MSTTRLYECRSKSLLYELLEACLCVQSSWEQPLLAAFVNQIAWFCYSAKCLSSLFSLPATALSTEYGPLLNCLCAWNQVTEVLQLIEERISAGMSEASKSSRMVIYWLLKKKNSYEKITNFGRPFASIFPLVECFSSWRRGNARKAYFSMMVTNVSSFEKHLTLILCLTHLGRRKKTKEEICDLSATFGE